MGIPGKLFFDDYDLITGKAIYIEKPLNSTWDFIEESYFAVDSVLSFEKKLSNDWADIENFHLKKEVK